MTTAFKHTLTVVALLALAFAQHVPGVRAQQAGEPVGPDRFFREPVAATGPALGILLPTTIFKPGDPLTLGVSVANPGSGPMADFFFGIRLPDGVTAVSVRLGSTPVFGSFANMTSLRPVAAGINLSGPFAVSQPALFQYQFNGSEPVGEYLVYFAALRAGALNDGVVGAGDLLALQTQTFSFATGGILLPGTPGAPALQATSPFYVSNGVSTLQISPDADGRPVARTQIEVVFTPTATVGQVNDALQSVGGRIVAMLAGVPVLLVEIPDPGSVAALEALSTQLRARPGVEDVVLQTFEEPDALPDNIPSGSTNLDKIDHLIAARAHAAWNTVAALDRPGVVKPLVLVGDFFGLGPPGTPPFSTAATTADFGTGALDKHGYHVLGIIAASIGGDGSIGGLATGLLPGLTTVRVVDKIINATTKRTHGDLQTLLVFRINGHSGNVVLNTSLGHICRSGGIAVTCAAADTAPDAQLWLRKVRGGTGLTVGGGAENRFVHATSAGNVKVTGDFNAATNGAYSGAALLGGLTSGSGLPMPNATNTLVVENRLATAEAPFMPSCLASSSKRVLTRTASSGLVNVSAVGTDVWSMKAPAIDAGNLSGTSMATPQVAALAAWVWALRPSLTNRQVMQLITSLARPEEALTFDGRCDLGTAAAAIDAYASVLATDVGLADAPVRLTLLDVAATNGAVVPDGAFTEHDVEHILGQFNISGGALDYSRVDLNGDGQTGGSGQAPFDLDFDRVYQTAARQTGELVRTVNENAATDIDILCHYGFTSLFTGNSTQRDALLGSVCGLPAPLPWRVASREIRLTRVMSANTLEDFVTATNAALIAFPDKTVTDGGESATSTNLRAALASRSPNGRDLELELTGSGTGAASGRPGFAAVSTTHTTDVTITTTEPLGCSFGVTFTKATSGANPLLQTTLIVSRSGLEIFRATDTATGAAACPAGTYQVRLVVSAVAGAERSTAVIYAATIAFR